MSAMKRLFRPPGLVLLAQVVLVGLWLWLSGRFVPMPVNDTPSYREFPWHSVHDALTHIRTPGYPAFLAVVAPGKNLAAVPIAHYLVYCLSVILFWRGLMSLGVANWPRAWVASALLYANILHGYVNTIASDTLAAALAIASVGLLFRAITKLTLGSLLMLATSVLATCLVRPAYLSLVVFVPILGVLLLICRRDGRLTGKQLSRSGGMLVAATFAPLLTYCGLRAIVVGQFGLVAFGGVNLIGIAGQFLEPEMVPQLPADLQPLAVFALEHQPPESKSDVDLMSDAPVLNYQRIENRYDWTIWDTFLPSAKATETEGGASTNSRLRRLAQAIIFDRPGMYVVYLAKAFRRAVYKIVGDTLLNPYCLALCLGITVQILLRILRWRMIPSEPERDPSGYRLLDVMTLTALLYAVCQMVVVILVCPPLGRMTDAMALFVPSLLMAILIDRKSATPSHD
ncbi:MAG: hypothetical protein KDA86_09665 [Planctomycetaceae bacterium]|nr:hypothetical protein [Planctomycetaceae bacterium]